MPTQPKNLLSVNEAADRCALSRVHLYRLIRRGDFPQPVEVAPRRVAFLEPEVEEWIDRRIAARESPEVQARAQARSEESSRRVTEAHRRGRYAREATEG